MLTGFRRSGELGTLDDKIVYITKLFDQEMHVLVRTDSGITSLEQLRGKTVNFSDAGSATDVSARDIFSRLGIEVKAINAGQADALVKMQTGEVTANVLSNAKPAPVIGKLSASDGFRLLPVPYSKEFHEDLFPATITHADYPNLIPEGQSIETVAYGSMIIALQLAEGQRPASPHRPVRRPLLLQPRRTAEAAAPPEMARGQPGGAGAGLEALRRC